MIMMTHPTMRVIYSFTHANLMNKKLNHCLNLISYDRVSLEKND